ncbi:hypothetical protein IW150_005530 [Coemansia sp. RSA 2607]|nr:hypothetical protein IW150_005530 [Coemansia sp. RSA 2607]
MSEVIAYEDSPLAEYLREIEATETLVVNELPTRQADESTSETPDQNQVTGYWISKLPMYIPNFWNTSRDEYVRLVAATMQQSIEVLTQAGMLSERYTPNCKLTTQQHAEALRGFAVSRSAWILRVAKHLAPSLATAALVFQSNAKEVNSVYASMPVAAFCLALISLNNQRKFHSAVEQSRQYIAELIQLAASCRAMDAAVQRAIKSAQEIEFVARGFRLPHSADAPSIANRPGQGANQAAKHTRHTIATTLAQSTIILRGLLGENLADTVDLDDLTNTTSDENSLEQLRRQFSEHFALRRQWLCALLEILDRASHRCFATKVPQISKQAAQYRKTADHAVEELRRARESQYTAKRWESFAATSSLQQTPGELVRSLTDMSSVLETVQAKLCVCHDFLHQTEAAGFSEDAARVFASLKHDIDMLNMRYQQAVTLLTCSAAGDDEEKEAVTVEGVQEDVGDSGDDAHVVGCTPVGLVELDAPGMVFEADMEPGPSTGKSKVSGS